MDRVEMIEDGRPSPTKYLICVHVIPTGIAIAAKLRPSFDYRSLGQGRHEIRAALLADEIDEFLRSILLEQIVDLVLWAAKAYGGHSVRPCSP